MSCIEEHSALEGVGYSIVVIVAVVQSFGSFSFLLQIHCGAAPLT